LAEGDRGYAEAMTDGQREDGAAAEPRRAEESAVSGATAPAAEAAPGGQVRPGSGRDDVVREDEQRLRDLDDEIKHARALAEDVIGKPEPSFADAGTVGTDEDDPTLAPPG
jgi:hypothetical protein